jgi:hypothetical protein
VACRDTDRLISDGVNVTGIKSGDTSLLQIDAGTWSLTDLPVIFHTGDDRINVRVEKSEAAHNFTNWGFSFIYMPSPRLMEVTSPDLSGTEVLKAGDLHLEWNNKTRLESFQSKTIFIDISGQQTAKAKTGQTRTVSLSCVAFHDKCHTIPAAAIDWLLQSDDEWQTPQQVDFVVSHRYQLDGYEYEDQEHTDYTSVESIEYHGSMLIN